MLRCCFAVQVAAQVDQLVGKQGVQNVLIFEIKVGRQAFFNVLRFASGL